VVLASDCYYSGGTIVLDHGLGLFSLYFHLSGFLVKQGDKVERGQHIGKVGATGRATGSHLHMSTRIGATLFNPLSLIKLDLSEGGAPEPAPPEPPAPRVPVDAPQEGAGMAP
jgi:murein DD-endopeptidase MepM/ murein hydrolase activator NlpD